MNGNDTAMLVNLIVATWPTGPKGYIWTDVLAELDHGPALEAYRNLRDDSERAPSVARFKAEYRARQASTQPATVPDRCELCDGTGWIECLDERRHRTGCQERDTCFCHAVTPCRCRQ